MSTIGTTSELRTVLLDAIGCLREKTMETDEANAISNLSGKVIASKKLDLDIARFSAISSKHASLLNKGTTL